MLSDLEKRNAYLDENQDVILDGLYSAYDLELSQTNRSFFKLFIVIVLLCSLFTLFLVFLNGYEQQNHITENTYKPKIIELSEPEKENADNVISAKSIKKVIPNNNQHLLRLDENIFIESVSDNKEIISDTDSINRINDIFFESSEQGINLVMKMPREIDYLVYGLDNPDRIIVEVNNAQLGFVLEDLEPVEPIVAIRYLINDQNRFKLILESDQPLNIRKSGTGKNGAQHDLVVMMDYEWDQANDDIEETNVLEEIVDMQVEEEKEVAFKGELVKTPVKQKKNAYADKLFKQAYAEYKSGNISSSLRKLNSVLDHDPDHTNARSTLALILSNQGHTDLAYSVLNEGMIQYPDNLEWMKMYARLLLNEDKVLQAKEILLKNKPDLSSNIDYYALLAAVLQKLNNHNESARIYRNLLQINPLKSVWWIGLGISLESLKRYQDALYAYQKAYSNPSLAGESRDFLTKRISMLNNLIKDEST